MDGGHEAAGYEAEYHAWGEIVFSETMAELEVLVEHCAEGERDGLAFVSALLGDREEGKGRNTSR